jgi:flagellar hook-associated protein 2
MVITIDGLASGFDTTKIIQQLTDIERQPENALKTRIDTAQKQQTALMELSAKLLGLRTKAASLSTASAFNTATLTSSDPDVLSVSGNVTAAGTYTFGVSQLAQSAQAVSRGFADYDTTHVGAGTLKLSVGDIRLDRATPLDILNGLEGVQRGQIKITDRAGKSAVVDLSDAVTVQDVIDKINSTDGIGVQARVNFYGSDGRGIELVDTTGLTDSNLKVEEVSGGTTAKDLGLLKSVDAANLEGDAIIRVSGDMSLNMLNDGNGVRTVTGTDFRIGLRDGVTTLNVDVSDARTLNDVVDAINNATGNSGKLVASISDMGLQLTDVSTSGSGTLSVTAVGGSMAAADLGIAKSGSGGGASYTMTGDHILADLNTVLLKSLNGGSGVGNVAGQADFHALLSNGVEFDVDIDSAQTITDVFRLISNAATAAGASPTGAGGISEYGNGIMLADGQGGSGNLVITALNGSTAAADLGILGMGVGDTIVGGDVNLKHISENTLLSSLNGGKGVSGGKIKITDSRGALYTVDLGQETTVGQVLRDINGASGGRVVAAVNETGDGIVVTDNAGGTGLLRIEEVAGGTTAKDLNILGTASNTGSNYVNGSFEFSVAVGADDTLENVRDKINALKMGVQVSIINVGGMMPCRLSVVGQGTGLANALNIDDRTTSLNFTATSKAQDAVLTFGSSSGSTAPALITSSTNEVDNVVPGMNLTLNSASSAPVIVRAVLDPKAAGDAVQNFVDAYNDVMKTVSDDTAFNTQTFVKALLFGSTSVMSVRHQLDAMISSPVTGIDGSLTLLSQIGVRLADNGQLTFDRTAFEEQYRNNAEGMADLFSATKRVTEGTLLSDLKHGAGVPTAGGDDFRITLRDGQTISVNASNAKTMGDVIRLINTDSENSGRLTASISEDGRSLKLTDSGPGSGEISVASINGSRAFAGLGLNFALSNSGGVFVGSPLNPTGAPGIAHQFEDMLASLTDPVNGSLASETSGLDKKIEDYNKSIQRMEDKIAKDEARLREQFANLEKIMSQSQQTIARLSALFGGTTQTSSSSS